MDADSLSSSLVLAVSLVTYAYLTLAQEAAALAAKGHNLARVPPPLIRVLRVLRLGAVLASSVGLLALLTAVGAAAILFVALAFLMLLLLLWMIQNACVVSARRWPGITYRMTSPANAPLGRLLGFPDADLSVGASEEAHQTPNNEVFLTEEQKAVLDDREQEMIRSILSLEEDIVREIMVPRVDVTAVEQDTDVAEAARVMLDSGHSRLPVYQDTIDQVVGVVHARDLLGFMGQGPSCPPLKEVMRPPFFIPESKRLDELLQEYQSKRIHMAIVVDEYGGTEGIVTIEDLLEEIVGEIEDEFSKGEPEITFSDGGGALVDPRVSLDDLNDLMGTRLEMEGVDTIGGYVFGALGRIPRIGDAVDAGQVRIEVIAAVGRRLRKLRVTPTPEAEGEKKS